MLGRCAFRCFDSNISIPRLSWSIWTWCLWLFRFYVRFLSEGSSSQRRWNRGRWIRRRPGENDRRCWFQAMADTLGTQTGFLDTDCEAKDFICAGELLMSLCNAASEGSIVNEDHVTIKYSFEFGLGTEVAYVWRVSVRIWKSHCQRRRQRQRTEGERRRFQRVCRG